jgi:hypothetical protein
VSETAEPVAAQHLSNHFAGPIIAVGGFGRGTASISRLAHQGANTHSRAMGSGIALQVPQPAKFAVHKLILAQRRDPANRHKRSKDLDQARALIDALLAHDRFAIEDTLVDAQGKGRAGWAEPIAKSLDEIGTQI